MIMEMDFSPSRLWLSDRIKTKPETQKMEPPPVKHLETKSMQSTGTNHTEQSANIWDQISLHSIKKEKHDALYVGKSPYQNIEVIAARDIRMYLNGQLQFSSLDERIYHEAFVHIPMCLTQSHKRILILGGGDGLALREVLKYKDVQQVDLVDIDSKVLSVAKNVPEMAALNHYSLHDKRVKVYAIDALRFLAKNRKIYDIIIVDFPDPEDEILANLYAVEVFETLYHCLTEDGILVRQSNSPDVTPKVYWSIGLTIEHAGFYTRGYHTIVPSFDDWGFHLGCKKPIPDKFRAVSVPHKTLPKDLASLFHFNKHILSEKKNAVVNRRNDLQLHHIFKKEIEF
jgi:spermidine synthase